MTVELSDHNRQTELNACISFESIYYVPYFTVRTPKSLAKGTSAVYLSKGGQCPSDQLEKTCIFYEPII